MNDYKPEYFKEEIFSTDYTSIAKAIFETYKPKCAVEFGCGPGNLTRELSKLNISVDAIDGFDNPDFKEFNNITFEKIDLNNKGKLSNFLKGKYYDIAICTEVAEHLNPESSEYLIKFLTDCAPIVIFSAAVPEQNGYGHINCKPRSYWHNLFVANNFIAVDNLRKKLRTNENLAIWYKLNLLDYVLDNGQEQDIKQIIANLIESESYSSSQFYKVNNENSKNLAYLNYPIVKQFFTIRNLAKQLLKK